MPANPATGCYHHGDLKNALLDAAERLLVEKGVAAISLREVARSAGVSHTAPYRHFSNKAALLHELAHRGFEALQRALDNAGVRNLPGPEQQLVEISVTYVRFALANRETLQLMFGGVVDAGRKPGNRQAARVVNELLVEVINAGIGLGIFRERDATELALVAWTSMHGLATLLMVGPLGIDLRDPVQLDKLVRGNFQNIIYGIAK
ncbi:MAG: TetR/AcrR family transcriptional regulator [Thiohalobacterales bacterium]